MARKNLLQELEEKSRVARKQIEAAEERSRMNARNHGITRKKLIQNFFGSAMFRILEKKDIVDGGKIFCIGGPNKFFDTVVIRQCIFKKIDGKMHVIHSPLTAKAPERVDRKFIKEYTNQEVNDFDNDQIRFFIVPNKKK